MVITQIQHPTRPRQPLHRQTPQPTTLIERRHTLIGRTQRPRPTTHTHHQQTPEPIINNHPIRHQTLHTHTNTNTTTITINNHLAINTAFIADDNTRNISTTVNTTSAHPHRTVPDTTSAEAITNTNTADTRAARSGILRVIQHSARLLARACRRLIA